MTKNNRKICFTWKKKNKSTKRESKVGGGTTEEKGLGEEEEEERSKPNSSWRVSEKVNPPKPNLTPDVGQVDPVT